MHPSNCQFCGFEVRAFGGTVAVLTDQRVDDGVFQFIEVTGHVVGQVAVLGAAPHGFDGIEIWRVSGQPLDREPASGLLLQDSHRLAMDVEAVQNDDQLPTDLPMQSAQKGDHIIRHDVAVVELPVDVDPLPLWGERDRADRRQAVMAGQVVASVKVAPHLVAEAALRGGERAAREHGPLVGVRPYRTQDVAAIAMEAISADSLERFERGARAKIEALGSRFAGVLVVPQADPDTAAEAASAALAELIDDRHVRVVLIGGVSAGDPLSPFWDALRARGGTILRRGVPAHPGSMIWIAAVGDAQLLGLPTCGMFSLATAADLVLPRLLAGERLTAESLAELGHGGLLTREMRFRFPAYARDLGAPEG